MMEDPLSVQDVFAELHRFHIYDHDSDQWVMSGVKFDERVVIKERYSGDIERFSNLDILTGGKSELQLIWEDQPLDIEDPYLEDCPIDMEESGRIAEIAQDAIAEQIDVHPDDIYVSSIEAPNVATFGRRDNTHEE